MTLANSKICLFFMSVGVAGVIAGVSYAAFHKSSAMKPKSIVALEPIKDPRTNLVPNRQEFENYLVSMGSFLETPPRDGVFGSDRIPMLHGKVSDDLPPFKAITNLQGKIQMRSAVVGFQRVKYSKVPGNNPDDQLPDNSEALRITPVHLLTPAKNVVQRPDMLTDDGKDATSAEWEKGYTAIQRAMAPLRENPQETFSTAINLDGRPAWILAKAVHASVNSCYSCHRNIKHGEPIGYTVALVSEPKM